MKPLRLWKKYIVTFTKFHRRCSHKEILNKRRSWSHPHPPAKTETVNIFIFFENRDSLKLSVLLKTFVFIEHDEMIMFKELRKLRPFRKTAHRLHEHFHSGEVFFLA